MVQWTRVPRERNEFGGSMQVGDLAYIAHYQMYGIIIGHGGWKDSWRVLGAGEFLENVSITKIHHGNLEVVK